MKDESLAVSVVNVHMSYGRRATELKVLNGINMAVTQHSIYALLGASGCGKTTLLRCCLGFLFPQAGHVTVMGQRPASGKNNIPGSDLGYMPQDMGLMMEFSILETMYYFGVIFRMSIRQIRKRAKFLSDLLDLPPLNKRVCYMSGGEQRRVSFALALLQEPPLLIMDEPTVGMDSLLRQSVWHYLLELTQSRQTTVIITTHYIDEARRANKVGLMRGGVLLTQASPEHLIESHAASTLEEVFITLAYQQQEDGYGQSGSSIKTGGVGVVSSIQQEEQGPRSLRSKLYRYLGCSPTILHISLYCIISIAMKTLLKTLRSASAVLFLILIPVTQILAFILFVGGDVKDVSLYYVNNDTNVSPHLHSIRIGDSFIRSLSNDTFDKKRASQLIAGQQKVRDGDATLVVYIPDNFTSSLLVRPLKICQGIATRTVVNRSIIEQSTIQVSVDASDTILLSQISIGLAQALSIAISPLNATGAFSEPDVVLSNQVYGALDWEYIDIMSPALLIAVVYYNAVSLTAMSFVVEKKEGLFERSYAAGCSVLDFIIGYTVQASMILLLQIGILMLIVFVVFDTENKGNLFIYLVLAWLVGLVGNGAGLLISTVATNEVVVIMLTVFSTSAMTFVNGSLWPLHAQPKVMQYITSYLPLTQPSNAASSITSKDFGLADEAVYLGFLTTLGWALVAYMLSLAFFRNN